MSDRTAHERKMPIGADHTFVWVPADGYPHAAPPLTVRWPSGAQTYALSPVRAADTVAGYDHANARLSLTVGGAVAGALRGLLAEYAGEAWLDGGPDYQGPVRVLGLVSDGPPTAVVQIAEPLPYEVDVDGTWTLRWLTYTATVPSAHAGSSRLRNVKWVVPWERRTGADAPSLQRSDRGILHVVHQPFATGLRDAHLYALVPGWARVVPDRQSSWAEQRWLAEQVLVARLRPRLPSDRYEDDVLGDQLLEAHALYTAALVRSGHAALGYQGAAEDAERWQREADAALERALLRLTYLDLDDDAEVDAGETAVVRTIGSVAARSNVFDSGFTTAPGRPTKTNYWDPR